MSDEVWSYLKAAAGIFVASYVAYAVGRDLLHIRNKDNLELFVLVVTFISVATSSIWLRKRSSGTS